MKISTHHNTIRVSMRRLVLLLLRHVLVASICCSSRPLNIVLHLSMSVSIRRTFDPSAAGATSIAAGSNSPPPSCSSHATHHHGQRGHHLQVQ